jgi:hypothetical protein
MDPCLRSSEKFSSFSQLDGGNHKKDLNWLVLLAFTTLIKYKITQIYENTQTW